MRLPKLAEVAIGASIITAAVGWYEACQPPPPDPAVSALVEVAAQCSADLSTVMERCLYR